MTGKFTQTRRRPRHLIKLPYQVNIYHGRWSPHDPRRHVMRRSRPRSCNPWRCVREARRDNPHFLSAPQTPLKLALLKIPPITPPAQYEIDGKTLSQELRSSGSLNAFLEDLEITKKIERRMINQKLADWDAQEEAAEISASPTPPQPNPTTPATTNTAALAAGKAISFTESLDSYITDALSTKTAGGESIPKEDIAGYELSTTAQSLIEGTGAVVGAAAECIAVAKPLLIAIKALYGLYKDKQELPAHLQEVRAFARIVEQAVAKAATTGDGTTAAFLEEIRKPVKTVGERGSCRICDGGFLEGGEARRSSARLLAAVRVNRIAFNVLCEIVRTILVNGRRERMRSSPRIRV